MHGQFTDDDEKMMKIFNVFAGIALENARTYHASIDFGDSFFGFAYAYCG
jgi:hypothetical protein